MGEGAASQNQQVARDPGEATERCLDRNWTCTWLGREVVMYVGSHVGTCWEMRTCARLVLRLWVRAATLAVAEQQIRGYDRDRDKKRQRSIV